MSWRDYFNDNMPEECMDEEPRFEEGQAVKVSQECYNCKPETLGRVGVVLSVTQMLWDEPMYEVELQEVPNKWFPLPKRISTFRDSSLEHVRRSALRKDPCV